jgi:hypothetical protein
VKKTVLILLLVLGLLSVTACAADQNIAPYALYDYTTLAVKDKIGIGTTNPQWPLTVLGNVDEVNKGVVHITNESQINSEGLYAESWTYGIKGVALTADGTGVLGFCVALSPIDQAMGKVGDGTGVSGLANSNAGKAVFAHNFDPGGFAFYAQGGKNYFENNVGIGTHDPDARLTVQGSGVILRGCNELGQETVVIGGGENYFEDNVGIGTHDPDAPLTIQGEDVGGKTVILKGLDKDGNPIVEIGKGLDYSETFPTSQDEITPGTVMVIDPVNEGFLTISTQAYDKKVAGIIAGANGLGSGVKLGTSANGDYAVALAGRAYCNVDTQYGEIEPGDLLTTSPTPGHAMVVRDFSEAQGAILGKAMEGLSGGGKGQILVLVTLQ